ncbi:MAG: hypothetical protein ACI9EF_002607 [Pseudohongiellaceae bacterium]|jgi:hypothetical protein
MSGSHRIREARAVTDSSKLIIGAALTVAVAAGAMLLVQDDGPVASREGLQALPAGAESARKTTLPDAARDQGSGLGALATTAPAALKADVLAPELDMAAAAQSEEVPDAQVRGRLVDEGGRPVAGARLVYHGDNRLALGRRFGEESESPAPLTEATSDRDGRFELSVPMDDEEQQGDDEGRIFFAGNVARVAAIHSAFTVLIHDCPTMVSGEDSDLGTLTMITGSQIQGRVVNAAGRPISEAEVTVRSHVSDLGSTGGLLSLFGGRLADTYTSMVTGNDGRFSISGVRPGPVTLSGEADGFQVTQLNELVTEPGLTLSAGDVVLAEGASISGWIVDASGDAVEGAEVRVSSLSRLVIRRMEDMPRQQIGQEMRLRAETDGDGFFSLDGLGLGQYTVHVSADGFARSSRDNVPAGTTDLSIGLDKLGGLLLSVRSSVDDSMVDGATVFASPAGFSGGFAQRLEAGGLDVLEGQAAVDASGIDTDPSGMYYVSGAGADGLELSIRAEGFAAATVTITTVGPGSVEEFDVLLRPESTISGVVLDITGQVVPLATVRLEEFVAPSNSFNGEFEVSREIRREIGGPGASGSDDWKRAQADDKGAFALKGVPHGEWELSATADGFAADDPVRVSLVEGQSVNGVEVPLLVAGSLSGIVVEQDGEPVKGARVTIAPVSPASSTSADPFAGRLAAMMGDDDSRRANTDQDGHFKVSDLLPGLYDVKLVKQQGMRMGGAMMIIMDGSDSGGDDGERVEIRAREETFVEVVRPPTSKLTGRVLAGGRPIPGVTVELKEAGSFLPFGGRSAETDDMGRYVYEEVEPGDYDVSAIVPGSAMPEERTVTLRSGQEGQQDLVFAGSTVSGRLVDRDTGEGVGGVTINLTSDAVSSEATGAVGAISMSFVTAGPGGGGSSMTMDLGGGDLSKVRTSPNGDFRIEWVKPGSYGIDTQGGGFIPAEFGPFDVKQGRDVEDISIKADRGAVLAGRVMSGQSGQLLDGVPVQLSSLSGGDSNMAMTENGRYTFDGLSSGEYSASVMGSGFGSAPLASELVTLVQGESHTLDLTTTEEAVAPSPGGTTYTTSGG